MFDDRRIRTIWAAVLTTSLLLWIIEDGPQATLAMLREASGL